MTILVGVLCRDGVVVGSDSSKTHARGKVPIIEQAIQKIHIVGDDVICAGSGPVGFAQRFVFELDRLRSGSDWDVSGSSWPLATSISRAMVRNLESTQASRGAFEGLVALQCATGFHLFEFTIGDFQPEAKTNEDWFVTLGSGQGIGDPFFGLMKRTLFQDQQPNLREGIFSALWTLYQADQLNPGGIKLPAQIATLSTTENQPGIARHYSQEELSEHWEHVTGIEKYLYNYRNKLQPKLAEPMPIPQASS